MNRPLIAVALGAADTDDALRGLEQVAGVADLAEIRLDFMRACDLPRLLRAKPCPVIITHRPRREGGRYEGDERERVRLLRQAIDLGAEHVDIEWDAVDLLAGVERGQTRLIVSRHDFEGMPADFVARCQALAALGGDIVKLVGMAHGLTDLVPVARVLRHAAAPTIAIAMGAAGMAGRILALRYPACYLTFATLGDGSGTAPGQIATADLRDVYHAQAISAGTIALGHLAPTSLPREALVVGNAALRGADLDAVWVPLTAAEVTAATLTALDELEITGCSVDAALAGQSFAIVTNLTPAARRASAVDTLRNLPGEGWLGHYVGADLVEQVKWAYSN
jgi:3-dehydroquinate dehydratase/shikimate dehydrogenase